MTNFSDSEGSDSDSFSDDSGHGGASTMMSLLSSYYGVEDDSSANSGGTPKANSSDIDGVGFDPKAYVRKLFDTSEVNDLLREDTKLVHDIKTLDSDMQMLVYENYNKFISATETIKRMKTNVEAMDDDMAAVSSKMETIIATSTRLDNTLTAKRNRIDKLVRIKRLLARLEFLSELPERLESMIEQEMYKPAIQLYNRTISVLTKQENVLSFKKIKEKTENMMRDLRYKVLSLMDSNNLEAQQLTQYVGILKLMECPRDMVMEKFLAAHKRRSLHMIKTFIEERESALDSEGNDIEAQEGKSGVLSVMGVRTFHQNVLVGLIESSNGISELFPKNATDDSHDGSLTQSNAYDELQGMIGIVIPEYVQCLTASLSSFFKRYNEVYEAHHEAMLKAQADSMSKLRSSCSRIVEEEEEDDDSDADENENEDVDDDKADELSVEESTKPTNNDSRSMDMSKDFSEINEERQKWILLTRQIILDCQYLDSGTESVRPPDCDASLPHADSVAEAVLGILDEHFSSLFNGHMQLFKNEVELSVPVFEEYADMSNEIKMELKNPDSPSSRSLFPRRLLKAQKVLDSLSEKFFEVFASVCKDSRSIYETHAVSRIGKSNVAGELMTRYCKSIAETMEGFGGISIRPAGMSEIYEESGNKSDVAPLLDYDSTSSTSSIRSARSGKSAAPYNGHCSYKFAIAPSSKFEAAACLLTAVMFTKVLPTLIHGFEDELKKHDISVQCSKTIKESCTTRLEDSCLVQLEAYIGYHAEEFSSGLTLALKDALLVDEKAKETVISVRDLSVTQAVLTCAKSVDSLMLLSCCLLLEGLPAPQIRSSSLNSSDARGAGEDRETGSGPSRRASVRAANNQAMYNYGLQLDIERMFSKKVNVFDTDNFSLCLECILGVVMKAALKASIEEIRVHSVGPLALSQASIDFSFLKQVMSCALKDAADVECLVEEVLVALASRTTDDSTTRELTNVLPKAVNDGLYMAGKKCVLLR